MLLILTGGIGHFLEISFFSTFYQQLLLHMLYWKSMLLEVVLCELGSINHFTCRVKMFSHAEELWPILDAIRKGGYLPMLLIVRDPDSPLAEHPMHPPIHTEIHVAHMDQLKEMVNR